MREYWILTKLQLISLFGINKIVHMKDSEDKKQAKRSVYGLIAMVFALGYVSVFYSLSMASAFQSVGMLPTLLGIMALACTALVLVFSIFETKGVLFGFGDYDIVMSWPVSVGAVAASRVTNMYAYNFVYAALLLIPAGVIYAGKAAPAWWYYPLFLLLVLLIPALPTIIGAIIGSFLTVVTARSKKSNILSIIGQLALVCGIMFFSFRMNTEFADASAFANSAGSLQAMVENVFPPAYWFQNVLTTGAPLDALWLLLLSAASIAFLLLFIGRNFVSINSRIKSHPAREKFVMRAQVRSSRVTALFRREWSRYFSSSLYVVNTAFGHLMLLAAGVFCVVKPDIIRRALATPELGFVRLIVPFLLSWIVSMSTTTASAVSMEGKRLWVVKSMPIPARDWLTGKLMVSMTLAVPSILISCTLVSIGIGSGVSGWFWAYVLPLLYAVAFAVFGLWLNMRMPKLDWQGEAEVIKQSGATMICMFVGMAAAIIPAVIAGVTQSGWVLPVTALILVVLSLLMWRSLVRTGDMRLYRLN
jgi:ABC-2 type transport system permease protein